MSTVYITSKFIERESLESRPEEDFGFNYEDYENFEIIGDEPYHKSEAGLVKVDTLIQELLKLQDKGVNYVGCDWHCDHQELDLYGFNLTTSKSDEIQAEIDSLNKNKENNKAKEIAELEERLKFLKKDLEN